MVKQVNRIKRSSTMDMVRQEAKSQGFPVLIQKTRNNKQFKGSMKRLSTMQIVRQEAKDQGFQILNERTRRVHKKPSRLIQIVTLRLKKSNRKPTKQVKSQKNKQRTIQIPEIRPVIERQQTLQNTEEQVVQNPVVPLNFVSQPLTVENYSNSYKICLGWISRCDVDASILMYDEHYNKIDHVSYMKLRSDNNSCIHSGDDQHGKNKDGDNEVITIKMNELDPKIKTIWPVINVYSGFKCFKDISGVYCKILDQDGNTISRVDLQNNCYDNVSNGCIMSKMTVDQNKLSIQPKGLYTKNTTMATQMVDIIQQVANNDFSNITCRETQFNC